MAAKNAFALLRLQDGEEPEKALEQNVEKYKQNMQDAKKKAMAPKHEKPAVKETAQKPRSDKPRKDGERRAPRESNGERGERGSRDQNRGPRRDDEPSRRDDGARHRERPEGRGTRPPRRENDRKSQTGRRPQDDKRREESKLNLGKATEAETEAAADAEAETTEEVVAAPEGAVEVAEPEEPKEVILTLAEFRAQNKGVKAVVKRQANEGEDASKFKSGSQVEQVDDMNIVDSSTVAAGSKSKKGSKQKKEKSTVDLKLNFYQHDKGGDERPPWREPRESRAPGSERAGGARDDRRNGARRENNRDSNRNQSRGQTSQRGGASRTPDFASDAAFPALG